ncbi:hypothetical protein WR25_14411 isoform D [Diploscapter pachys]|uniref:Uncharacterized protein n=1 Tax=Diploscapter pachys TaxID=2018661 RepID=A0A2A2JFU3_9BILA|nr:hypothetical protein WR25_14411 isoform C [Diploscapter pachys]PAV60649.1 hypothetical protein WR25_14411 isoform D [Diploscapter pachys]
MVPWISTLLPQRRNCLSARTGIHQQRELSMLPTNAGSCRLALSRIVGQRQSMDGRRGIRLTIFTVLENVWNKTTELYEKFKEQPLRAVILILVILSLFAGATLFVFFVRHPEQTAQIVANQSMSNDIPCMFLKYLLSDEAKKSCRSGLQ